MISRRPRSIARIVARATRSGGTPSPCAQGISVCFSRRLSKNSVAVVPGLTSSTSIPRGTSSERKASEKPRRANLLAQYSLLKGMPRWPMIEPMLTMIGRRPSRSSGKASRVSSTAAKKLTSMMRRSRSGEASSNRPWALMPALFTSASRPPSLSRQTARHRPRVSASVISPATDCTLPRAGSACCCNSASRSSRRASATTRAPCSASCSARARPMPLDAPVTNTRLSAIVRRAIRGESQALCFN